MFGVLGIAGTILPEGVDAHPTFHKTLASIRRKVAVAVGICKDEASTPGSIPKIAMASRPTSHKGIR
jgi:2-methylaconitate cis-trans-isomerase PrpF